MFKKTLALASVLALTLVIGASAQAEDLRRVDPISIWADPDPRPGQTFNEYWAEKQFTVHYREAVIHESTNHTYFMITGGNVTSVEYYGGVQQIYDGRRVAIFSVWDVKSNCTGADCKPEDADPQYRVQLHQKGEYTVTERFGYELTGLKSMIYDANWKIGERIQWLVVQEPAGKSTVIAAAYRLSEGPWRFIASYLVPKRYPIALTGGYSFVEDYGPPQPMVTRSMTVGPTILEDAKGTQVIVNNMIAFASQATKNHRTEVSGTGTYIAIGASDDANAMPTKSVRPLKPTSIPDYSEGKKLLKEIIKDVSTLEAETPVQPVTKSPAVTTSPKATPKKKTITCQKGKTIKKITAVAPRCPSGFKLKK
jgi:hypothetical protein